MNPQSSFSRLKTLGKRSLADFVKLDTGRVGSKNALALGSLVGGSVLMELFLSGVAHATYCYHSQWTDASSCTYTSCTHSSDPPGSQNPACTPTKTTCNLPYGSGPYGCPGG